MSALPRFSDIELLGYGERVINLDSEIADRALVFVWPSRS
jgi:hypothetical protein